MEEEAEDPESLYPGIVSQLESLQGEFANLGELQEMERNYAQRLVECLRQIQEVIDVAIPINPQAFGGHGPSLKEAYLLPDAVLMLVKHDGYTESRPLSKLPPEMMLSVLYVAAPELKKVLITKRKQVAQRVKLLEKILKGLKKAEAMLRGGLTQESGNAELDAITAALEGG